MSRNTIRTILGAIAAVIIGATSSAVAAPRIHHAVPGYGMYGAYRAVPPGTYDHAKGDIANH